MAGKSNHLKCIRLEDIRDRGNTCAFPCKTAHRIGKIALVLYISCTLASNENECHETSALKGNWFLEYKMS
jgi:hypothetical protein